MQQYCYNCMNPLNGAAVCPRCRFNSATPTAAPYHLCPGTVLNRRYLIGNAIGEGGFGITYIGLDLTLTKRVAVKEFYPSGAANRTGEITGNVTVTRGREDFFHKGVERFMVEAKSVAAFSDEDGIVDVLDYFQTNNTAYIVMEYLEGENLKNYVKNHGRFTPNDMIALMLPVMKSLRAMHAKGVIHRDISPDNIMFTKNSKLKLMDFGSARYFTNEERKMSIVLKKGFAPVEQYRSGGGQGPHTDVYALCATIYTCITGREPPDSLDRLVRDTLIPPSELGVDITPAQENTLLHGLAVRAEDRCQNMDELMKEFSGSIPANPNIYSSSGRAPGQATVYAGTTEAVFPQQNLAGNLQGGGYPQSGGYYGANSFRGGAYQNNAYQNRPYQNGAYPVSGYQNAGGYPNSGYQNGGYDQPPKKSNAPVVVAIVISVIAILAVGGIITFLLLSGGGDREQKNSSQISENVSSRPSIPSVDQSSREEKTTEPDETSEEETSEPETTATEPPETKAESSGSGISESQQKAALKNIVEMFGDDITKMPESRSGSSYDYALCDDNRIWVGTKGSFHDDDKVKVWYFFDENHKLYFAYERTPATELRYYIYNDQLIKCTVGIHEVETQRHILYGDSELSNYQHIVNDAYRALDTVS